MRIRYVTCFALLPKVVQAFQQEAHLKLLSNIQHTATNMVQYIHRKINIQVTRNNKHRDIQTAASNKTLKTTILSMK